MDDMVCRAITFINYNMPIRDGADKWEGFEKYFTTGFFDFMYTKRVPCQYEHDQLRELWNYGVECIARGEGCYAHQSVFCFSQDSWNGGMSDVEFWNPNEYRDMLLTFVVFIQTKDYIIDVEKMGAQCEQFNEAARKRLEGKGLAYTYGTVDKNDFVVCIRSKDYKKAVDAIMALHDAGSSVVYSYSVFGISEVRQQHMSEEEYAELNCQEIDSISLKGVTNSVKLEENAFYPLNQKYFSFCKKLVEKLYDGRIASEQGPDYKIYDILGDNDFRLIARMVPLGNLIRQLGKGGLLSYYGKYTQFTFFSTHLVLNTRDLNRETQMISISDDEMDRGNAALKKEYKTEQCEMLKNKLNCVMEKMKETEVMERRYVERLTAACQGGYQLLQSLTAMEAAPTKKYDFFSMYYPLKMLVNILEEVCDKKGEVKGLAEDDWLYDFIHKISMTLHGTLRTDIQFFQIRDFNATLHYAPAKLRAYYTLFVFVLSAHVKEVSSEKAEAKRHGYIFCPGMFKDVAVRQLRRRPENKRRLMLITVPERYLYSPKNLSIILTHEVGHLAGERLRKRNERHSVFLKCSFYVLCMELTKTVAYKVEGGMDVNARKMIHKNIWAFYDGELYEHLRRVNDGLERVEKNKKYMYYSEESIKRIGTVFKKVYDSYGHRYCVSHGRSLEEGIRKVYKSADKKQGEAEYELTTTYIQNTFRFCELLVDDMKEIFKLYNTSILPDLLHFLHYLLSEPISDILAILVLGLTPDEYLQSIADELLTNRTDQQFGQGIRKVRIALVIHVMEQLQKIYRNTKQVKDILRDWQRVYMRKIPCYKQQDLTMYSLALEAFDYQAHLWDMIENIDKYQGPIDQEKKTIVEKRFDFLDDTQIFCEMVGYLKSCGEEYLKQIIENKRCRDSRKILRASFQKCAGNSPVEMMVQVDAFLHDFEKIWKDEYF